MPYLGDFMRSAPHPIQLMKWPTSYAQFQAANEERKKSHNCLHIVAKTMHVWKGGCMLVGQTRNGKKFESGVLEGCFWKLFIKKKESARKMGREIDC